MKLLVATIAVAVAAASPALAKSKKKRVASPPAYGTAVVPSVGFYERRAPNPSWDVYGPGGRYIGSDPDSRIRLEMSKDAWGGHGPPD